jgi:zinc finger protein
MNCTTCHYHKADVESDEDNGPVKYTLEVSSEDDLKIRIIKASTATVKIPHVGSIEPGEAASGYVTNVEGIINRLKKQVEILKEEAEDKSEQKKAKNILKKLTKALWGQEKIKIILDDPKGNSAIVSEKAEVKKGKK